MHLKSSKGEHGSRDYLSPITVACVHSMCLRKLVQRYTPESVILPGSHRGWAWQFFPCAGTEPACPPSLSSMHERITMVPTIQNKKHTVFQDVLNIFPGSIVGGSLDESTARVMTFDIWRRKTSCGSCIPGLDSRAVRARVRDNPGVLAHKTVLP